MYKLILVMFLMPLVFITSSLADDTVSNKENSALDYTVTAHVKGMVCDFCARGLEKSFGKRDEVSKISVSLKNGLVKVQMNKGKNMSDKAIKKIITNNGYNLKKIERGKAVQVKKS